MKRLSKNHVRLANMAIAMAVLVWPGIGNAEEPANQAEPARQWIVYVLPHSHIDIGYTHCSPRSSGSKVADWTSRSILPRNGRLPGRGRSKWNTEVLWAVDSYLPSSPPKSSGPHRAIRAGQVEIDALYCNELRACAGRRNCCGSASSHGSDEAYGVKMNRR